MDLLHDTTAIKEVAKEDKKRRLNGGMLQLKKFNNKLYKFYQRCNILDGQPQIMIACL